MLSEEITENSKTRQKSNARSVSVLILKYFQYLPLVFPIDGKGKATLLPEPSPKAGYSN